MVQCHCLGEASIPPPPMIRCILCVCVTLNVISFIFLSRTHHTGSFLFSEVSVPLCCPGFLWSILLTDCWWIFTTKTYPQRDLCNSGGSQNLYQYESPNSPKVIFDHSLLAIFTEHLLCTRHSVRCFSHVLFSFQLCLQVAVSSAPLPSICRNWATYWKKCYELSSVVKHYLVSLEGWNY